MSLIPRHTLIVHRPTGGSYIEGKWVPSGTTSDFTIDLSVQPLRPSEMDMLPEGRRKKGEAYKCYGENTPKLLTVKEDENPDIIEYDGKDFEVFSGAHSKNNVINNSKYVIIEVTAK